MGAILNILFVPLVSIMVALLYTKLRQVSGEQLKETLDQFEMDEVPRSKWQKKMQLSLILFVPLVSIMVALLYTKLRQVSGEQLKETLDQFEMDEVPRSKWQKKMQLSLQPRSGKHGDHTR